MIANPAYDLAAYLQGKAAGAVTLARGANVFIGPMRAEDQTPSPAVFLLNSGGPPSTPYLGGERIAYFRSTVQVLIRGAARQFEASETFARALLGLLHLAPVPLAGGPDTYVAVLARDSAPAYLSEDDSRRALWGMNFECQYRGQTG